MGGSKKGGSGGGTSTQTVTQQLSPEQKKLLNLAIPVASEFVQNPPTQFPEAIVQPFTPEQLAAQQSGLAAATQIEGLTDRTMDAQNFLFTKGIDPTNNPFLQKAIQAAVRPINESLTQSILPNIRGEAGMIGGFGGSRQGIAEGLASQGALRQIGDTSATISSEAYQAGLDALTKGLFASPEIGRLALMPSSIQDLIGRQIQSQEERRIAELAQRHMTEQTLPFSAAQSVAGLAFGIPGGSSTATTVQGGGGGTSPTSGMLGGAAIGTAIMPGWGTLIGGAAGLLGSLIFG